MHSISNSVVHGAAAGEDGVGVEIFSDVDVALHDRVVSGGVDALSFNADK